MKNLITNKEPNFPSDELSQWRSYSVSERYFYLVLCYLWKKYENGKDCFIGHDIASKTCIPSFKSFRLSQKICKGARKKLKKDGLIAFRHIYGNKGYRVGTEYTFREAAFHKSPKEIHALIFNKRPLELSTPECLLY